LYWGKDEVRHNDYSLQEVLREAGAGIDEKKDRKQINEEDKRGGQRSA